METMVCPMYVTLVRVFLEKLQRVRWMILDCMFRVRCGVPDVASTLGITMTTTNLARTIIALMVSV